MLAKNQNVGARWIHSSAKPAYVIVCSLKHEKAQFRRQISVALIQTEMDKKVSVSVECCKTLAFKTDPNWSRIFGKEQMYQMQIKMLILGWVGFYVDILIKGDLK